MAADRVVAPGARVRLHLALSLADGTVVEDTFGAEPLELTIGEGSLDPGLEMALLGLAPGRRQRLEIAPGVAFGGVSEEARQWLPRGDFPPGMEPEPGLIIAFSTPTGDEVPGAVLEVEDERVLVDFNHPLAGRDLVLDVEVLEVEEGPSGDG